jgi:hypothetical protein
MKSFSGGRIRNRKRATTEEETFKTAFFVCISRCALSPFFVELWKFTR